ncbi:MAG: fructose-1,6-bisphosphatase [Desulfovibrionaceae bacterium]|nr:fructose-1,6-bisphosphatase [Desulfovibrionaceae bacterium]
MKHITLSEYYEQKASNSNAHLLAPYIKAMAYSGISIRSVIANASIDGIYGYTGTTNIHGEAVQHLDVIADTCCIENLKECRIVAGVVSEEQNEPIIFDSLHAPYVAVIDPLDGSSNIETNNTIGTIFCLFKRVTPVGEPISSNDFLQRGTSCVCAGYIAYGPATMLVVTTGNGVDVFTYSSELNDFILIEKRREMPSQGPSYSINEAYLHTVDSSTQEYIKRIKEKSSHSLRYVGSLVADTHRILWKGGIFIYPTQYHNNTPKDKLRLLCECIPIAFLIEQAGGEATNGSTRILSLLPQDIHERSALYYSSQKEMEDWKKCMQITS